MFYKFIDQNTIRKAPRPLNIGGKDVFTNSEEIHNSQGYYRLINTEYPQDEKAYQPIYSLENNAIVQGWVEVEVNIYEEVYND